MWFFFLSQNWEAIIGAPDKTTPKISYTSMMPLGGWVYPCVTMESKDQSSGTRATPSKDVHMCIRTYIIRIYICIYMCVYQYITYVCLVLHTHDILMCTIIHLPVQPNPSIHPGIANTTTFPPPSPAIHSANHLVALAVLDSTPKCRGTHLGGKRGRQGTAAGSSL